MGGAGEALSTVITLTDASSNDFNLSPGRYVVVDGMEEVLGLEDAVVLLSEAEEERAVADRALDQVLSSLGFQNWRSVVAQDD